MTLYKDPKIAVLAELRKRNMSITELADALNRHQQSVSRTVGSSPIDSRSLWNDILSALDIEVVYRLKSDI